MIAKPEWITCEEDTTPSVWRKLEDVRRARRDAPYLPPRNRFRDIVCVVWVIASMLLAAGMVFALAGCASTVSPEPIEDSQPSFDGNTQNSGFLGFTRDGSGIITANARERYNLLIAEYGDEFLPALERDEGIVPLENGVFLIYAEHLVKFATMNRWRREGRE